MKTKIALTTLLAFVLVACCLPYTFAQVGKAAIANEAKQIHFAERVVTIELARALSPSFRAARETCIMACPETGALELAIGLIGIGRSNDSSKALANLLGLRLDGAGSEELNCQILIRGSALIRRLERLQASEVAEHYQSVYLEVRKRELANVSDVKVEQVCRSEVEIRSAQAELLKAIKEKVMCEQ